MVIKAIWYWHEDRHRDQWKKIESPDTNPYIFSHRILTRDAKNTY